MLKKWDGAMQIYGLRNCDTCRMAAKALPMAQMLDIRQTPVPGDVLDAALLQFGAALVNRRSTTWRGLSEAERAKPPRDLLQAHPALMKRPLIDTDGQLTLGWDAQTRAAYDVS